MFRNRSDIFDNEDVKLFKKWVAEGTFYKHFQQILLRAFPAGKLSRHMPGYPHPMEIDLANLKTIKAEVMLILFSSNAYNSSVKTLFKQTFPTVHELIKVIKTPHKKTLPILLQRLESHLVLYRISSQIAKDHPYLPISTIHDSIVTTMGNETIVQQRMEEELTRIVGLPPNLKIEYWLPEQLTINALMNSNPLISKLA